MTSLALLWYNALMKTNIFAGRLIMKTKRILALVMLLAVAASSFACVKNEDNGDGLTSDTAVEIEALPAGIEKCDYGNEAFNILAPDDNIVMLDRYTFALDDSQEYLSDPMNKAMYDREVMVEEYLGIEINYLHQGTYTAVHKSVNQMVMSGDDSYQLVLPHCIGAVNAMFSDQLLYDFYDFEYVNLEADWWNHAAVESLSTGDHLFYAVSDMMLPDPNCVLVNLDLIGLYELEDPYDIVRDGKWTLDKMMEMMGKVTLENGDNVWDINDQYGLGTPDNWYLNSFFYSSGITLTDKNEDGLFYLALDNERTYTLMEKLDELLNGGDTFVYNWNNNNIDETTLDISKGRVLFNIATVRRLYTMRDTKVNYGILPFPKLDESQENYSNNSWASLMCVPKTVRNPEMIGKAMELLAYYSESTAIPAYFDIMLGAKLSRDEDSVEMLNIIFDSIIYDAGFNFLGFSPNTTNLFFTPHNHIVKSGQNNFASWLNRYKQGSQAEIDQLNEAIAALD